MSSNSPSSGRIQKLCVECGFHILSEGAIPFVEDFNRFLFVLSVEKVHKLLFYRWSGLGGSAL